MGVKGWISLIIIVATALSTLFVLQVLLDPTREIPDPYYRQTGPNITSESELRQILPLLDDSYEESYFDCSEMSAFLEWYLEGRGVDTVIVTGKQDQPHNITAGGFEYKKSTGDHAWIVANISGREVLIESTLARIVPDALVPYYIPDDAHDDIYGVVSTYGCADEYDWWTVVAIESNATGSSTGSSTGSPISLPTGSPMPFPTPIRLPPVSELESDIFDLVNREREKSGLTQLKSNEEIAGIARLRSCELIGGMSASIDDDSKPADLLRAHGVYYFDISVEETLALPGPIYDYEASLQRISDLWTRNKSESESESGTDTSVSDIDESGIGVSVDPDGNIFVTRLSIRRIYCGYRGAPCCKEQGYYPWCYKPWRCNRGICN